MHKHGISPARKQPAVEHNQDTTVLPWVAPCWGSGRRDCDTHLESRRRLSLPQNRCSPVLKTHSRKFSGVRQVSTAPVTRTECDILMTDFEIQRRLMFVRT